MALNPGVRRPVYLASYGVPSAADRPVSESEPTVEPVAEKVSLRRDFPPAGSDRYGGTSDGYCLRVTFAAGRADRSYAMLRDFLREEGYGDVPLPADVEELRRFRLPPRVRVQLSLFGDDGYVHNPVKVLFPPPGGKRGALILEVYDERSAGHLLRFHRR